MSRTLSSIRLEALLQATIANAINSGTSAPSSVSAQHKLEAKPATTLTHGTGANQADRVWQSLDRTLNSAASEDIDLYDLGSLDIGGGAGKDATGQAVTIAEIVGLLIVLDPTLPGALYVGGKATTAAFQSLFHSAGSLDDSAGIVIQPGGIFLIFSPADPAYAVADTANHLLKLAAVGGNVKYSIAFIGRSS